MARELAERFWRRRAADDAEVRRIRVATGRVAIQLAERRRGG